MVYFDVADAILDTESEFVSGLPSANIFKSRKKICKEKNKDLVVMKGNKPKGISKKLGKMSKSRKKVEKIELIKEPIIQKKKQKSNLPIRKFFKTLIKSAKKDRMHHFDLPSVMKPEIHGSVKGSFISRSSGFKTQLPVCH